MNTAGNRHRFDTEEIRVSPGEFRDYSDPKDKSIVVTMGTGTPSPNPYRRGPSGALVAGDSTYLIDAGESITRALAKATASVGGERADCFMPERLNALDPAPPRGYMVTVHEITDDGIVQVDAFFHPHGNLDNLGYCFTTPDKIIVWTGDGRLSGGEYRNTWVSRTCLK